MGGETGERRDRSVQGRLRAGGEWWLMMLGGSRSRYPRKLCAHNKKVPKASAGRWSISLRKRICPPVNHSPNGVRQPLTPALDGSLQKEWLHEMVKETSQPESAKRSRDHAEETDGLLSPLLPESLTPQLSAHYNVQAARAFPESHAAARLPPSLNSIGF